jgi:hypothetical protein
VAPARDAGGGGRRPPPSGQSVKVTIHLQLVDVYVHSPICFNDVVLN